MINFLSMMKLYLLAIMIGCTIVNGFTQELTSEIERVKSSQTIHSYQHPINYVPRQYVCNYTGQNINIDGRLEDIAWEDVSWTELFVDIQGDLEPKPSLLTRVKMTWDDSYFYVAAKMQEPHVWATLTKRDAIMFQDDDFEIFIDPDNDGHNYFEFEINAFNAIWDLYMLYPYYIDHERNYIMNWDIRGIKTAVHVEGTINDPSDTDEFWTVEVAIPWNCFKDFKKGPGRPNPGDQWRINFSRVDWTMDIVDDQYVKRIDKLTGKRLSENNWVWSPTGYINMHKPEVWGYVQFERISNKHFVERKDESIKWGLWQLYYQIKDCRKMNLLSCELSNLTMPNVDVVDYNFEPEIFHNQFGFTVSASSTNGELITINEKGRLSMIGN